MQKAIPFRDRAELARVLGVYDRNVRLVRDRTGARIYVRDGELRLQGSRRAVEKAYEVLLQIQAIASDGTEVTEETVEGLLEGTGRLKEGTPVLGEGVFRRGAEVRPLTPGQAAYLEELDRSPVVLVTGPAGTGKTFLAVAKAVQALRSGAVRRIILVRPVVEAGERLGFLPGDIENKVNPYLRPVYDALNRFLELGRLRALLRDDIIEIAPLAYMRGRTLDESFVVLDEGQNTTKEQMKMFLTRLGNGSRFAVTGDITQIDLPPNRMSGMVDAIHRLKGVVGIGIVHLTNEDIVRHPLVQKIVERYERSGKSG